MLHVALCHAKHIRILVGLRPFLHELSSRALHNLCSCSLHSCLEQLWTLIHQDEMIGKHVQLPPDQFICKVPTTPAKGGSQ